MWNLLMGGFYSTEEEESDEETQPKAELKSAIMDAPKEIGATSLLGSNEQVATKHRIPSLTREQPDGMENEVAETKQHNSQMTKRHINLPTTNIVLDKLPPITDSKVQLPAISPSSPLVRQVALAQPHRECKTTFRKTKEPKFVPYEPYKAAVTPLVEKKALRRSVSHEKKISESEAVKTNEVRASRSPSSEVREVHLSNEAVNEIKKKLDESEKQMRIQLQVNSELKKLLVASVGEDIEARVDFLTQDKARLAADIRQFSNKISRDFEEKEKLSVESNLWKSKFLACSLIVDELARWKGALIQHNDDYEHYVRLMLHEHAVLWETMQQTHSVLDQLRTAFDPIRTNSPQPFPQGTFEAASLLGMADRTLKVGEELRDRLLGQSNLKVPDPKELQVTKLDTPAEEGLKEIMNKPVEIGAVNEMACNAVTGAAKPLLKKLGDQALSPGKSEFKCCTHCQGTIHVV